MLHLQYSAGVSIYIIPNTLFSQQGIIKTNASYTWEEENNSTKGFTPPNFSTCWYPVTLSALKQWIVNYLLLGSKKLSFAKL